MAGSSSAAARPTKRVEPRTLALIGLAGLAVAAAAALFATLADAGTVQAVREGLSSRGFWTAAL